MLLKEATQEANRIKQTQCGFNKDLITMFPGQ